MIDRVFDLAHTCAYPHEKVETKNKEFRKNMDRVLLQQVVFVSFYKNKMYDS